MRTADTMVDDTGGRCPEVTGKLCSVALVVSLGLMQAACDTSALGVDGSGGSGSAESGSTAGGTIGSGGSVGTPGSGSQQASAYLQSADDDGLISIEAEHYDGAKQVSSRIWRAGDDSDASGSGVVEAVPNSGSLIDSDVESNSPGLDYSVNFNRTGTHYVWLRMYAMNGNDNSAHVGLNGVLQSGSDRIQLENPGTGDWEWSQNTRDGNVATINVEQTGVQTLNLWMREDGAQIDKIVLVHASNYTPSGSGPAESDRSGGDGTSVTVPGGGNGGSGTGGSGGDGGDDVDLAVETGGSTDTGGTDGGGGDDTDIPEIGAGTVGSGGTPVDRRVSLSWNPSTSGNVKGYYVYHGTIPDHYVDKVWVGSSNAHEFQIAVSGDHFFAVTAVSQDDVESGFSVEASVSVSP